MTGTDAELIADYASTRSAECFAELVSRYRDMVYSAAVRVVREPAMAEDVTQECFLQLARRAASVTHSVAAWLHTVAVNASIDALRSERSRRRREAQAAHANAHHEDEASWDEVKRELHQAVEQLPEELRAPLVLHFLAGRSQKAVASELGVSQPTVSRRINEGVDRLRRHLKQAGVVVSVPVLAMFLDTETAEAAPAALIAELGEMALAGVGWRPAPAGAGGAARGLGVLASAKAKIAGVALASLATVAVLQHTTRGPALSSHPPAGGQVELVRRARSIPPTAPAPTDQPLEADTPRVEPPPTVVRKPPGPPRTQPSEAPETTLVAQAAALPAVAPEQYALQMKYAVGEQRSMRVMLTAIGSLAAGPPGDLGEPSDLWMNGTAELSQEVKAVDTGGTADVEWRLGSLDAEVQLMGMRQHYAVEDGHLQMMVNDQLVFDSLDPAQAKNNPMLALLGQGVIVRQDRTGKVVGMPQFELLLAMMMPEADLKEAFEQGTGPLPPGPVKVGDTWEERQVWPYGIPEGTERPVFITRHTFEGLEPMGGRECAKIASASSIDMRDVRMDPPMFALGSQPGGAQTLGATINAVVVDTIATHYFDIERGTTLKWDSSVTVSVDLTQRVPVPKEQAEALEEDGVAPPEEEEQEEAGPAETPDAEEIQEIEVGMKIEDLVIDIGVEVGQ